jgi:chromosome segregation ATPase/SAM-dependent methyltransferase
MTSEAPSRAALHPSLVLSAYVEPLVRGRRVAVLGDATTGLADELGQRGARLVHVYDPDAARTAEALARSAPGRPHQVAYAVLAGDLGVRDGAFDAVLVPDLSLFSDPADVMRRARRLAAASGVAVFVTPNAGARGRRLVRGDEGAAARAAGALGYYELFDLVSLQFAKVRMVGQAPFVGYTVAEFAPAGEPEVSVDTSLLTASEEPEHFIAIASDRAVALDAYAVIELPWREVAGAIGAEEEAASARVSERLALAEAQARLALVSAELDKAREREGEAARVIEAREQALGALSARVEELGGEVAGREARLRDVEARAGDNHVRAERLVGQVRDLEEELVRQRDRGTRLSKQLDDEKRARQKAELELGMVRGKPEIAGAKDRIDALGADLEAARARIAELEQEAQAVSTPRRPAEAAEAPAAQDAALLARIAELEQAVNAALAEAGAAAAQRDTALEQAKKLGALVERGAGVEAQLVVEQRERAEITGKLAAAEARAAEAEQQLAAELARAEGIEARLAEAVRHEGLCAARAASAERQLSAAEHRLAEQGRKLAEAEHLAADREPRLSTQARRIAELEHQIEAERARAAAAASLGAADEAAAELARLEAQLVDRGRVVAALTRDLRESERVGRELLGELTARGATNGVIAGAPDDLRARLDALAESAARSEADLQAAHWRIAQLERELGEARRGEPEPASVQIELEQALSAARDEVARLRRALGQDG